MTVVHDIDNILKQFSASAISSVMHFDQGRLTRDLQ